MPTEQDSLLNKQEQRRQLRNDTSDLNNRTESHTEVPSYYSRSGANERSPLLDPSDPAVSPLNSSYVWTLRLFLLILTAITFAWFTILLINCFVTIPFILFRTSGFLELDLAILNILILLLAIFAFQTPSEITLKFGYIVAGETLIQLLLVLLIPYFRRYYGALGIFSLLWSFLVSSCALVLSPIVVLKGKTQEEIRLTGRPETRRTWGEMFRLSSSLTLLSVLVVVPYTIIFLGFLLEIYDSTQLVSRNGPASGGQLIPIYDTKSHLHSKSSYFSYSVYIECTPENLNVEAPHPKAPRPPVVVIESDDRVTSQALYKGWVEELYKDDKVARVCFWNRPGRGFSDVAPSPYRLESATEALTYALNTVLGSTNKTSSESSGNDTIPFANRTLALVSHGLGGIYSRAFAAKHVSQIQSITLIDTLHEHLLHHELGATSRGFLLWLRGLASPFYISRQLSWLLHQQGPLARFLGLEPDSNNDYSHYQFPFKTRPQEIKATLQDQISAANGALFENLSKTTDVLAGSKVPLAVVSSAQSIKKRYKWDEYQRLLTKVTSNNVAWEIFEGPHSVWVAEKAKYQLQQLFLNVLKE